MASLYNDKSYRLSGYDYSQDGYYFITVNIIDNQRLFGEVTNGVMNYSVLGSWVEKCWLEVPKYYPFVKLNIYQIMPSHIHGIIIIDKESLDTLGDPSVRTQYLAHLNTIGDPSVRTQYLASQSKSPEYKNIFGPQSNNLYSIIRGFKIGVSVFAKKNKFDFCWKKRFHDRIIRDDDELNRIREYIVQNPENWEKQEEEANFLDE